LAASIGLGWRKCFVRWVCADTTLNPRPLLPPAGEGEKSARLGAWEESPGGRYVYGYSECDYDYDCEHQHDYREAAYEEAEYEEVCLNPS